MPLPGRLAQRSRRSIPSTPWNVWHALSMTWLVERSGLLIASTSFGGIHSSVDRRARWGDPVGDGFARISLGIEDTDDLIADFEQALG